MTQATTFAWTAPGSEYPAYVNISKQGCLVSVTARAPAWNDNGVSRCGETVTVHVPAHEFGLLSNAENNNSEKGQNFSVPVEQEIDKAATMGGFTPLSLHKWNGLKPDEVGKYWEIRGGTNVQVDHGDGFMANGFNLSGWIPKEAAEFIVHAANCHDELVATLSRLVEYVAQRYPDVYLVEQIAALEKARTPPSQQVPTPSSNT